MNKGILIFCVLFCMTSIVISQAPPFEEVCETTKYPPNPNTAVKTYQLNLDLPAGERWKELATQFKGEIKDLVDYILKFVLEFSPELQKIIDIVDNDLGFVANTLPAPYGDEIIGIANATGINLGEIVLYNIFYEVFTLCTSIVGEDPNGNILHGRNLDFGLFLGWDIKNDTWKVSELLRPLIINIENTKGGVVQYKTVTFVGFVGLFEWILNINREQKWPTLYARDILESNMTYEDAVVALTKPTLIAPIYYIVGGPESGQGAVVTRDRRGTADVWKLGTNNTWFIAETNYDHWEKPLFVDDRITPTNRCMNKFGQDNFSFSGLFNVLSSKPVLNKLTTYTALIEVKTGKLETYIQYCPTPCWPF